MVATDRIEDGSVSRRHEAGTVPVPVRPAATLLVVRDGDGGSLEVLMLRRSLSAVFMAGAYVFPGGAVDPHDLESAARQLCTGRSDASASATLGVDSGGLAWWVAAVRECFEEAGILLALDGRGGTAEIHGAQAVERVARHRSALRSGATTLVDIFAAEGFRIPAGALHYFAHWITPEGESRRYDTRFFATRAPGGQVPEHDGVEAISDLWIRPADALARHEAGEMELFLPTVRTLQTVARFSTSDGFLDWAQSVGDVRTMRPWRVATEDGTQAFLPPDACGGGPRA